MSARETHRFCRTCGSRLARDNPATDCTPCQIRARDRTDDVPDVPPEFWELDQLQDALSVWHIGEVIRAYRHHPFHGSRPLPQERVARWLHLTQAQLSRIESGPAISDLDRLTTWAITLGIPAHLLWFKLPEQQEQSRQAATPPPPIVRPLPHMPTGAPPLSDEPSDMATVEAFRAADRQVGGGHLYPTVVGYLQNALAPRLFGTHASGDGAPVFAAASGLTDMAGWMAHDAGHDGVAERHFRRSLDLASAGGDAQLTAHVYASMSHLSMQGLQPKAAVQFARQGQAVLEGKPPVPALTARLLAMEARGLAAMNEPAFCARVLLRAEQAMDVSSATPLSPWVSPFDAGSLASEMAHCMRQLGQLDEAERQSRRIVSLRASSHARSRAFANLLLVGVLIEQGRLPEACTLARDVLDATQGLSSHRVTQQLHELSALFRLHHAVPVVAEFLPLLQEVVRQRLGLYRWLTGTTPRT